MSIFDDTHSTFSSLQGYSRSGTYFQSANPQKAAFHCDFVSFLGVAQIFKIDFLPITWQPALDSVGQGATAEIHQALVALQTSFAFKRPILEVSLGSSEDEDRLFQVLIAEISILGQSSIRDHPNILTLEGICWDITSGGQRILPVLVFEKTRHGDLQKFMRDDRGRRLDFMDRFQICIDVGRAILEVHSSSESFVSLSPSLATNYSSDIIHGDIKPQNVLIFGNGSGGYTAKVADFGYSTLYVTGDELIAMPRSRPWTAPEWHHRGFRVMEAMKMDAYSFGMLVLWLLFCNKDSNCHFEIDLDAKQDVLVDAITKTQSAPGLDEKQRKDLACFFNATLVSDPARRCSDFKHLLFLLSSYE